MSEPYFPEKVTFFCGLIYRADLYSIKENLDLLKSVLSTDSNPLIHEEKNCSLNEYYEKEMGDRSNLKRVWIFSNTIDDREFLIMKKKMTNLIEVEQRKKFEMDGRPLNIDPGYIGMEQVVLATNKPYSHRMYYGEGIYGELTYQYLNKTWCTLPWTYPDYRLDKVLNLFEAAREQLKKQLKMSKSQ
jgi:hypothetical protein